MKASKGIAYTKTVKYSGKEFRLALMEDDGEHYLETQYRWAHHGVSPEWRQRPGSGIQVMEQLLIAQLMEQATASA